MGFYRVRWLSIGAAFVMLFCATTARSASTLLDARFQAGDNPAWSDVDIDDDGWRRARLDTSWARQGIDPPGRIGWYRTRFDAPTTTGNALAVRIGMLGNVDEVFLNGVRVGGSGRFGRRFVQAPYLPRVYLLPPELLRDGSNLLAIRTQHTTYDGGITEGVTIGPWHELQSQLSDLKQRRGYADMIVVAFLSMLLLLWSFVVFAGSRDRASIHLGLFLFLACFASVVGSIWFQEAGHKTPWIQTAELCAYFLFATPLLSYALHFFEEPRPRRWTWLIVSGPSVALLAAFALPLDYTKLLYAVAIPVLLLQVVAACVLAVRGFRRRVSGARVILAGFALAGAALALEATAPGASLSSALPLGLFPSEFGAAALLGCLLFAYVARAVRLNTRFTAVMTQLTGAREAERERLARELHDGVAQNLLAIRFQMQDLAARTAPDDFERLGNQLSDCVDELRELSASMRSTTTNHDLRTLLQVHAQSFGTRVHVNVEVDETLPATTTPVREHLYRIFQEAVSNATRHGGARKIDVTLCAQDDQCELCIQDDGRGFDVAETLARSKGLGLWSMRERANLLGGRCEIRSSQRGTTIFVSVPAQTTTSTLSAAP